MSIIANKNKVFIKQVEPETKTVSGLYIPDTVLRNQLYGIVVSVGEYDKAKYGEINVGDKVAFGKYAGEPFEQDGENYLVMHPGVLFSVIKEEKLYPIGSLVIVEIETMYRETVKMGGVELLLDLPKQEKDQDIFFDKRSRILNYGKAIAVPTIQPVDVEGNEIEATIQEGDDIHFRFMNIADEKSYLEKSVNDFSEKRTLRVPYEDIFCIVRNGEIIPVGEWVLGEPYIDSEGEEVSMPIGAGGSTTIKVNLSSSGLITSVNDKPSIHKAIVRYAGAFKGEEVVLRNGDIIFSKIGINFENEINGKSYYCFLQSYQVDVIVGYVGCGGCKNKNKDKCCNG